jgi:hypothetical protein
MEGMRQILKATAWHMVEYRDSGGASVDVEVLSEDEDEEGGREDAESSTGVVKGSDVDDLGDHFEGATTHERLSALVSSALRIRLHRMPLAARLLQ